MFPRGYLVQHFHSQRETEAEGGGAGFPWPSMLRAKLGLQTLSPEFLPPSTCRQASSKWEARSKGEMPALPQARVPLLNLHANMEFRPGRPLSPLPAAREGPLDLKRGGPGLQVLCGHISNEGPCAGAFASLNLLFLLWEMMNSPA